MFASANQATLGPTMIAVLRRYLRLVLISSLLLATIAAVVPILTPDNHVATAILVVEDPSAATLFDSLASGGASDAERYVNDQAAILRSTPIATTALLQLDSTDPEWPGSTVALLEQTTVSVDGASNVIEVEYASKDPAFSVEAVNAIVGAYEALVEERRSAVYANAIAEVDASIATTRSDIADMQADIVALVRDSEDRLELDDQFHRIVARLVTLQRNGGGLTEESRQAIDDLNLQLLAIQGVNNVEVTLPGLRPLIDRRSEAIQRESQLISRRDGLTVDAQLQRSGLALTAPALSAEPVGRSPILTGMAGLILGAVLGAAIAYWLSEARRRFEHRLQPQEVLGVPLLGDIPRLVSSSGGELFLPVLDDPDSAPAHAFRSLAGVIQQKIPNLRVTLGSTNSRGTNGDRNGPPGVAEPERAAVLAVVSASDQTGKTMIALNTAAAAARNGLKVLVVDGDIASRGASRRLLADQMEQMESDSADPIVYRVVVDEQYGIDVLGWGLSSPVDSSALSSNAFRVQVSELSALYDLILMDLPALLSNAPAADAVRLADSAILVIPHHSLTAGAEDVRYRLDLIGTHSLGYVYTHPRGSGPTSAMDAPSIPSIRSAD